MAYQSVHSPPPIQQYQPHLKQYQTQVIDDQQYFHNLDYYEPWCCYRGDGPPLFMINKGWYVSIICIVILNAVFVLGFVAFLNNADHGIKHISQTDKNRIIIANITTFVLMNFTYFLTQFLNPGVRNLSSISQQEYEEKGKQFCSRCQGFRTSDMEHCSQCRVCIEGLDHHCGFFAKCIGGCQKFAFYGFLTTIFLGFISMLVTLTSTI